jgi:hypothetical protein
MTASQIEFLVGESNMNVLTHIPSIMFIAFKKDKTIIRSAIDEVRVKFDSETDIGSGQKANILEVIYVRPFSQKGTLPVHGNYDIMDYYGVSTVFEYMTDVRTGEVVKDYYDFDSIVTIALREFEIGG